MASHLIGSTDSPPPRSASVAECRTWSHGSQRMGLDANVSRKRLFGTRHDFGSGRADNTLQHGDHMFQTTTSQHFAPRRLHDTLAQGDTRLQRKLNEWDTQATLKKKESIGKIQHTQHMLRRAGASEKLFGGTIAQGGRVGKDPLGLRPSLALKSFESTANASFRNWSSAVPAQPSLIQQPPGPYAAPRPFPTVFGVPSGENSMLDRSFQAGSMNPRVYSNEANSLVRHKGPLANASGNFYMG